MVIEITIRLETETGEVLSVTQQPSESNYLDDGLYPPDCGSWTELSKFFC